MLSGDTLTNSTGAKRPGGYKSFCFFCNFSKIPLPNSPFVTKRKVVGILIVLRVSFFDREGLSTQKQPANQNIL